MTADPGREEPLLFVRVPGSFEQRHLSIEPGAELAYDESAWRDSIVQVEAGEIELECASGCCRLFGRGDMLWLDGISVRALRNPGRERAVLVAVSRLRRPREIRTPAPRGSGRAAARRSHPTL